MAAAGGSVYCGEHLIYDEADHSQGKVSLANRFTLTPSFFKTHTISCATSHPVSVVCAACESGVSTRPLTLSV